MSWASIVPSEADEQAAVIRWWGIRCHHYGLPEFALYHVPNEGSGSVIRGRRLKEQGVRPGIPDLFLSAPRNGHSGLYVEMKSKRGRPSPIQRDVLGWLEGQGYEVAMCHGADEAIARITEYLRG